MPVVALVGNKGGAGKTTLCINLAAVWSDSHRVVIVDADPQKSSLQWRDIADSCPDLQVVEAGKDVIQSVNEVKDEYDYCLIDCPPSVHSKQMQQALQCSDLAVIPVQPSPLDIWATVHIETEIEQARLKNAQLNALLVINQLEPRTRLSQIMHRALSELTLSAANTAIRRRAVYRNSFLEGRTVHDFGAKGLAAAEEIQSLISEMESCL